MHRGVKDDQDNAAERSQARARLRCHAEGLGLPPLGRGEPLKSIKKKAYILNRVSGRWF